MRHSRRTGGRERWEISQIRNIQNHLREEGFLGGNVLVRFFWVKSCRELLDGPSMDRIDGIIPSIFREDEPPAWDWSLTAFLVLKQAC